MQKRDLPVILSALAAGLLSASCAMDGAAARMGFAGPGREAHRTAAGSSDPAQATVPPTGPVRLTMEKAILLALENSREFAVRKFDRAIRSTGEDLARAAFDPSFRSETTSARALTGPTPPSPPGTAKTATNEMAWTAALDANLPTGTAVSLEGRTGWTDSSVDSGQVVSCRAGLTVTQALLRGAGPDVNLATLRQARLDTQASEFELRGLAEILVADVEKTCWDHVLAVKQIEIVRDSLELAERQLVEVGERIRLGKSAAVEVYAAQSEVAIRREDLINARAALDKTRVRLVRLLHLTGKDRWTREITTDIVPAVPEERPGDVADHIVLASRMRTDLNQARLDILRGEIEIVKTRNGLLPKLDVFVYLGSTGYARSFGRSIEDLAGDNLEASAGLSLEWPVVRRESRALHLQAGLSLERSRAALENLSDLVEADVRTAHIEVKRTREQIAATEATRLLREQALRAETEKFRVGKSTSLLVAQSQRDLLAARISEAQAATNHLKALVDLYRLDGSLLERRGIEAPGRAPVVLPAGHSR